MSTMRALKAHVRGGRLVLDEPTDLPNGEVVVIDQRDPDLRTGPGRCGASSKIQWAQAHRTVFLDPRRVRSRSSSSRRATLPRRRSPGMRSSQDRAKARSKPLGSSSSGSRAKRRDRAGAR